MPDLCSAQDGKHLLAKWNYQFAVFHIVFRDYKRVCTGEFDPGHCFHRVILKQFVSDLLDVEANLSLVGVNSPANKLDPWMKEAWDAAADWVRELRAPPVPIEAMPVPDIKDMLDRRKRAENHFNAVIVRIPESDVLAQDVEPTDSPTVLVNAI